MNRIHNRLWTIGIVVAVAIGVVGCAGESKPKRRARSAEQPLTGVATPSANSPATASATPSTQSAAAALANYRPPFPEREDMFAPPFGDLAQRLAKAANNSSDVVLKGIVNVDGLRAILQIDGQIVHACEGERVLGVDVVAVSADSASLRRGERTWTAALYDDEAQANSPHRPDFNGPRFQGPREPEDAPPLEPGTET